jgi:hypothetical protein
MLTIPFFAIARALGYALSFSLGWATSLFFGQIPGGKERVVSMLSALSLAWVVVTYIGGGFAAITLILHAAGLVTLQDPTIDAEQIHGMTAGIVGLPPLIAFLAELSDLNEDFSLLRWLRRIPASYAVALSLGVGVALMLLIGPIVLVRRRRAGRDTHHIPVLVADGRFDELVADIADELERATGRSATVGALAGLWSLPMRVMRYAAAQLFNSVVRVPPVIVVAGDVEVAAHAVDVNVTAPAKDAYWLRAALYKRFGVARMHLTWTADTQALERRLWELHADESLSGSERARRLDRLERDVDRAAIGSDEWNVLYRIVLQLRDEQRSEVRRSA